MTAPFHQGGEASVQLCGSFARGWFIVTVVFAYSPAWQIKVPKAGTVMARVPGAAEAAGQLPESASKARLFISTAMLADNCVADVLKASTTSRPVSGSKRDTANRPALSEKARTVVDPRMRAGVCRRIALSAAIWRYSGWLASEFAVAEVALLPSSSFSL